MSGVMRGTTPDWTFYVDGVDPTDAAALYVTCKQAGTVVLEKDLAAVTVTESTIEVTLSQADTLAFSSDLDLDIQIRLRLSDDSAWGSQHFYVPVEYINKEGVI